MYKIDKQQGYIVQYREIQPLFCNNLKKRKIHQNIKSEIGLCFCLWLFLSGLKNKKVTIIKNKKANNRGEKNSTL